MTHAKESRSAIVALMPAELQICAAAYEDLPEVSRVHVTSWKQTYVGQVPQTYLDTLDVARRLRLWQEQFQGRDVSGLLLAKVDGAAVGFVCFGRARDGDRRDWGEIYAIYVLADHWGKGIGYQLHRRACSELTNEGFEKAYLWVLDTNRMAIQAYERWGGIAEWDRLKDHVIGGEPVKEVSVAFR